MGDKKDLRSDFLFAMPSFVAGAGRVCDLFGVLDAYNTSASPEVADAYALFSDWRITGQDLRDAMLQVLVEEEADLDRRQGKLFDSAGNRAAGFSQR